MKFKFIAINIDYTLHKSFIIAKSLNEADEVWCSQYGEIPFSGNLNIQITNKWYFTELITPHFISFI